MLFGFSLLVCNSTMKDKKTTKEQAAVPKDSFKKSFGRLLTLAYPDQSSFIKAIGALCVSSLTNLLLPTLIGLAVDRVSSSDTNGCIMRTSSATASDTVVRSSISLLRRIKNMTDTHFFLGCLGIFSIGSVASWYRTYTVGAITENIAMRLRTQIYASVLRQDLATQEAGIQQSNTAMNDTDTVTTNDTKNSHNNNNNNNNNNKINAFDIVQALSVEADVLAGAVTKVITDFLRSLNSTLGGSLMLLSLSPKLTMVSLSIVPLIGITAMVSRMRTRKQSKEVATELSNVNGRANERIKHLRTVKTFARETYELNEYIKLIENIKQLRINIKMSEGIFMGMTNMVGTSSILGVLCFGGWLVKKGELTGGKLTAFMSYTLMLGMGSALLMGIRNKTIAAVAAAENVFTLLDRIDSNKNEEEEEEGKEKIDVTKSVPAKVFHGDIVFHNVGFTYPYSAIDENVNETTNETTNETMNENPEDEKTDDEHTTTTATTKTRRSAVLNGLNLTIQTGARTALVGPSGAGKSTVLALLLRLYNVDQGTITIGGVDINTMSKDVLLQNIGVVDQRPILWNISILENIRYGNLTATDSEIMTVIQKACLETFVNSLPNGVHTIVGEEGSVRMSGGQLARIAIARAMIKNPPILILDEATASLDSISEQVVNQAITELMKGRTTLVVGHSVDAIRGSHTCCVLENGAISEKGELNALLLQNQESRLKLYVSTGSAGNNKKQ